MNNSLIEVEQHNGTATIWLNRPEVRNAFNELVIEELLNALNLLDNDDRVRVIIIRGKGSVFCAGADLKWMKGSSERGYDGYYAESVILADCFQAVYECEKPTVAVVHGACMGGANGIVAACDFVLADESTRFSFSEVKLGIIPACIAPYVIKRIGEYSARELMLTGKSFDGYKAQQCGLVNESLKGEDVEIRLTSLLDELMLGGPHAQRSCKYLIDQVANHWSEFDMKEHTVQAIVKAKMSEEGQEGMAAFLEKRKPKWQNND
ncbi:enoyl-CoA hydratase-related protein [Marinoscillum sp. MHG1-6]|uniref:enoyl-CoA hydratase-related protein n=1 Tax=Marinoscillum sp. MHG1-6 TaxID=2959627 RepID=UPI0021579B08|nr:enoyl-CoA hydratase-related protein [Marinoscillum sp. MHG1-6]